MRCKHTIYSNTLITSIIDNVKFNLFYSHFGYKIDTFDRRNICDSDVDVFWPGMIWGNILVFVNSGNESVPWRHQRWNIKRHFVRMNLPNVFLQVGDSNGSCEHFTVVCKEHLRLRFNDSFNCLSSKFLIRMIQ